METVDSQVRSRRLAGRLSQVELAERAGVTRQAISAIEGGQYIPNTAVALRLSRALGCRVEDLFALPDALEEHDVELVQPELEGSETRPDSGPLRVVVANARGRWVAHALRARRGLQESFAPADGVLNLSSPSGELPLGQRDGGGHKRTTRKRTAHGSQTAKLLIDPQRLSSTALLMGCDPSLGIVSAHMGRLARDRMGARLAWLEAGSQAALNAVESGTAHLAGSHLRDAATGDFNVPQARRSLAATGGAVVAFASWEQGLVVARGNPLGIQNAADLARPDVRLINREKGAGSRTLLDSLLAQAGVPHGTVRGYERSVASHFEVACAVATGGADCGIALAAAAEAYDLDFVPLTSVRFDFTIPADHLAHPAVVLLLEALQTRALRDELRSLPGYDVDDIGSVRAEFAAA